MAIGRLTDIFIAKPSMVILLPILPVSDLYVVSTTFGIGEKNLTPLMLEHGWAFRWTKE